MTDCFQDTVFKLKRYWADRGCIIQEPYDVEVGAGTMCPETYLRVLGPKPYRVAYVQPSRRPADGRYGENPNRLYKHQQLQVILKPSPDDVLDQYLASLEAIGIDLLKHDIKFEEDNWEAPTLGAWGIGWQVMLDGLEITQFTYFQQCGGLDLDLVPAEITYGLERISAFLQGVESVYDIEWAPGFKYSDVRLADEVEFSKYNFELANVDRLWRLFAEHEAECKDLLAAKIPLPAYDQVLKCSHLFNLLDARGAISVTERVGVIKRVRDLAVGVARLYSELRHSDPQTSEPRPQGSGQEAA
jgi:glycyl-tRNA synthetase alpha chain